MAGGEQGLGSTHLGIAPLWHKAPILNQQMIHQGSTLSSASSPAGPNPRACSATAFITPLKKQEKFIMCQECGGKEKLKTRFQLLHTYLIQLHSTTACRANRDREIQWLNQQSNENNVLDLSHMFFLMGSLIILLICNFLELNF